MEKELVTKYMDLAIEEAKLALKENEVPVGAILLDENFNIVAKTHNLKEKNNDITAHAEILALKEASKKSSDYILENYTLFVTLEPCLMCLGALTQSHVKKIYCATKDDKLVGFEREWRNDFYFNNKIDIKYGVFEEKSKELLANFFDNYIRNKDL